MQFTRRTGTFWGCYLIDSETVATINTNPADLILAAVTGVGFWNVTTGLEVRHLTFPVPDHGADAVAISRDGKRLAAGGKDAVKLLDLHSGQSTQTLEPLRQKDTPASFPPHGKKVA